MVTDIRLSSCYNCQMSQPDLHIEAHKLKLHTILSNVGHYRKDITLSRQRSSHICQTAKLSSWHRSCRPCIERVIWQPSRLLYRRPLSISTSNCPIHVILLYSHKHFLELNQFQHLYAPEFILRYYTISYNRDGSSLNIVPAFLCPSSHKSFPRYSFLLTTLSHLYQLSSRQIVW
jgi:hypothetical protein